MATMTMPSHLRQQAVFEPFSAHMTSASFPHSMSPRPEKRQKLGIAATYRLAHRARGKLSFEASRGDHDLRKLVGHANTLDMAMIDLQEAEREQEAWFNQSVSAASKTDEPQRVQFTDALIEQHRLDVHDSSDEEADGSDSDSDSDYEEEVVAPSTLSIRRQRARSPPPAPKHVYDDDSDAEDMESDDEYDNLHLSLVRTQSNQEMAVPELVHDSSDDSDDEHSPSSPDAMDLDSQHIIIQDFAMALAQKQRDNRGKPAAADVMDAEEDGTLFLAPRGQQQRLVAAY